MPNAEPNGGLLEERSLMLSQRPLSPRAMAFVDEGRSRFNTVDCFHFVPSDYDTAWRSLDALPRGRFCEWGSGYGIVTGLAEMLGFEAQGIEINAELASASRRLLSDFGLSAHIETGDYFGCHFEADVYFVYCWPGKIALTESRFCTVAPAPARLLICYGQNDIRCKARSQIRDDR
jgi:hypothetical protein